jgi:hypothetical protein
MLFCAAESAALQSACNRRELLATTVATLTVATVNGAQNRAEALPFGLFEPKGPKLPPNVVLDPTLAYTFTYPVQVCSPSISYPLACFKCTVGIGETTHFEYGVI